MTFGKLPPRPTRTSHEEKIARPSDDAVNFLARLAPNLIFPGDPLSLSARPGAAAIFMPGRHGKVTVDVHNAVIFFAPGATADQMTVKCDCTIHNADLRQAPSRTGAVLQVESGAVVLAGLRVDAGAGPCIDVGARARVTVSAASLLQRLGADLVTIQAGGLAVFTATVLGPASTLATGAINNAGVVAAVDATGIVKLVPGAHVNVTVVSEV